MASLADIGYPRNDESLRPIIDQVLDCWLAPYYRYQDPFIEGKARRCASQQGNALFSILRLCDWQDDRVDTLVRLLLSWQWPDGGWNCDVRPEAKISSFWESLIPLHSLALYARLYDNPDVSVACRRAAELFLARKMYLSRSTGTVMHKDFIQLHYPCYWHYDILFGLKVMVEAGFIDHPNCAQALDLLESKRLPDGGWPAEAKYYRILKSQPTRTVSNVDHIVWDGVSKLCINEWVTVDALLVLRAAGRLNL
ncbi:MAG: hypothetical protein SCM11_05710 [Bacillota bacterium]|nr:hypothetical protein [Bacillota bacterium]